MLRLIETNNVLFAEYQSIYDLKQVIDSAHVSIDIERREISRYLKSVQRRSLLYIIT
jgi:hypothetical protein